MIMLAGISAEVSVVPLYLAPSPLSSLNQLLKKPARRGTSVILMLANIVLASINFPQV